MDIQDVIKAARERDANRQDWGARMLAEECHTYGTMKALRWALTTGRDLRDVFADFNAGEPGLVEITLFANRAAHAEFGGEFCYARTHFDGRPVISLTHPTLHSEEDQGRRYVTPDPYITNFNEFVAAVEAFEKTAEPETDGLTA